MCLHTRTLHGRRKYVETRYRFYNLDEEEVKTSLPIQRALGRKGDTAGTVLKRIICHAPSGVSTAVHLDGALMCTLIPRDGARDGEELDASSVLPTDTDEFYIKAGT